MRFFTPLISILFITGCKSPEVPVQIQNSIYSISLKWVPDDREGICSINLKMLPKNQLVITGETNIPEAKKDITDYLSGSGVKFYDSLSVIPDTSEIKKIWGLVSVSVCNIKDEPSHSSEMVSQAIMGTPVKILKRRGSWFLVQTPDYYIGWTSNSGITEMNDDQIKDWKQSARLIFTGKYGDILSEEGEGEVISDIVAGAIVKSVSEKKDFFLVELPDGRRGKINKNEVSDFKQWCLKISPDAGKLILFAKSLYGTPYMWGGTSTKATDCSGLTKIIYFTGGIILARDASLQFQHGIPVDISSLDVLAPGDLIFFGHLDNQGEKRITHVGMFIGDTEVINSSGMVQISSLDSARENYSSYLDKTVLGARRIIGARSEKGIEKIAGNSWYNIQY
jgi:hypothetical protein